MNVTSRTSGVNIGGEFSGAINDCGLWVSSSSCSLVSKLVLTAHETYITLQLNSIGPGGSSTSGTSAQICESLAHFDSRRIVTEPLDLQVQRPMTGGSGLPLARRLRNRSVSLWAYALSTRMTDLGRARSPVMASMDALQNYFFWSESNPPVDFPGSWKCIN